MLKAMMIAAVIALTPFAANAENGDIEGVISSQIDAFLVDDFERAFTYAAPSIKGMFRNSDNFGVMVKKGYPMVWRPSDVRFGKLSDEGVQTVYLTDRKGVQYVALYSMTKTEMGWKISGVQILTPNDTGA